jgi:hypothetical protein
MRKDVDLYRRILMDLETQPPAGRKILTYEDRSCVPVGNAGPLNTTPPAQFGNTFSCQPIRITAAGQQFLDAIRDETLWKKLKTNLGERLGAVPISVLTSLAGGLATEWPKQKLGLK